MTVGMLNSRTRVLRAALGFLSLEPHERELRLLHRYADIWRGIGDIVAGLPGTSKTSSSAATTAVAGARCSS
jgi:hypothetical protein